QDGTEQADREDADERQPERREHHAVAWPHLAAAGAIRPHRGRCRRERGRDGDIGAAPRREPELTLREHHGWVREEQLEKAVEHALAGFYSTETSASARRPALFTGSGVHCRAQ